MRLRHDMAAALAPLGLAASFAAAAVLATMAAPAGAAPVVAGAATVVDVRVEGHESLRTREVARLLGVAEGREFDEARLAAGVDSLLVRLAFSGRPFARVEAAWDTTAAGVTVEVLVDEGSEVLLGRVAYEGGDGPVPDALLGGTDLREGSLVTGPALAGDVESLLSSYAVRGRPFAEVIVPAVVKVGEDGRLSLTMTVSEGPAATFGDVVVIGNENTRDHVIAREAGIRRGTPYDAARLAMVRPRLERLAFLGSVAEPVVAFDASSGEATVGLEVTDATANRIAGVLGYAGGEGEDGTVTGLIDVELGNIAGTGRLAAASWERIRDNETEIAFSYVEPWLLGAPIDVGVSGAQSVRDTFYTTTEADLFVTARMGDRTRLTWSVGGESYVPGGEESNTATVRTAFAASYDGTDVPLNPTRGIALDAGLEYAAKDVEETGADESSGTLTAGAHVFVPVRRRQVLALGAEFAGIASTEDEVPFHEQLVLGGARSLRGYREEQFRGTRTALGTVEYRFILTRRSRVAVFVDAGYWYHEGSNPAEDAKLGYGIGLRGETRLGTISVDYGLGEGDGLLDGKLHVGVIRGF